MHTVLIYSRKSEPLISKSLDLLCEQLSTVGLQTEQTQSLNFARLILNPYQTIHFFIEELPLTVNELFFLTFSKTIGKSVILTLFNSQSPFKKPSFELFCPDALTVSQTNHLKQFRDWNCTKMILPQFPNFKNYSAQKNLTSFEEKSKAEYLIPLEKTLEECLQYKTEDTIYFDGRQLLKTNTSASLRKKWNQLIQAKKISNHYHIVLSNEKLQELINNGCMKVVLASPSLKHTDFIDWFNSAVNKNNLIILNDYQATSFSQNWTSGQNCHVVSTENWIKDLNKYFTESAKKPLHTIKTHFKNSEIFEPLVNELTRLYTKILHQKTTLLSNDSANIKA